MRNEEMWQAVSENNAEYDGLFFYAVKTKGYIAVRLANQNCLNEIMFVFLNHLMRQ